MTRRLAKVAGALALQLIALVLAHDLTFLVRYGSRYGEALVHAGHGATWAAAVTSSIVLAIALAVVAAARLVHLRSRVRLSGPLAAGTSGMLATFLRTWLRVSIRVGLVSVVLLSIQENVERLWIGQSAPGAGILLSPEYPFGLWIALAVGAGVALVASLFEHRERVLLARIHAAHQAFARPADASPARRPVPEVRELESVLGRRSALRAPPVTTPA